jgi:protein-tyrosine phosphatase
MSHRPIEQSYWVEENRFLAGEYPGSFDLETARRHMDAFLEVGINTFIDLTQSHELVSYDATLKEQAEAHSGDVFYHRFAIRDHSVPSRETMVSILDTIDDALNSERNVYVHCWGGVGRTGIVVGCYLVRHGATNEQALIKVNSLYRTRTDTFYYPTSPETQEQIEFVRTWSELQSPVRKSK